MVLQKLRIKDLILIESAEIELGKGLNIFTGETGAGKTALLTAIQLVIGGRADAEWIRSGKSAAIVEAELTSFSSPLLKELDLPSERKTILIRREIHRSGKSRCFVEDQLVAAGFLRSLMQSEIEMIDQNSAHYLRLPEEQQKILDMFGRLEQERASLEALYTQAKEAKEKLEEALLKKASRERDLERLQEA